MDCFADLRNPFLPLDVENPSVYHKKQRNLTGEGREERRNAKKNFGKAVEKMLHPFKMMKKEDDEAIEKFYELVCEDITTQRTRVGGDWVAAGVILNKHIRDLIR